MQLDDLQKLYQQIKHYNGDDKQICYTASLLFRLHNRFDLELALVERALGLDPHSNYMQQRKNWIQSPWFEKLSARPPIELPRDKNHIPKQQTLEKLCIVLAADDNYFEFLVESLESIKATRFYNRVDIKLLDVGLSDHQYFLDRWNLEFVSPGWPDHCEEINFFKHYFEAPYNVQVPQYFDHAEYYAVPCHQIRYAQAVINKPFIHELFPDYDYYLWIDADCWVQDERGLDKLVCLAEKQGHAFPGAYAPLRSNPDLATCRTPSEWHPDFANKPNTASSVFCNSKSFQMQWANNYRQAGKKQGFWWGQEEEVASYSMTENAEIIDFSEVVYLYRHLGFPAVKKGEVLLRNPETLEPIPIMGLGLYKARYFYPIVQYQADSLSENDLITSINAVSLKTDWSKTTPKIFNNQRHESLRYRCLSEQNHTEITEMIHHLPGFTNEQINDIQNCHSRHKNLQNLIKEHSIRTDIEQPTSNPETPSNLNKYEYIALREAQVIVKRREKRIEELEQALQEAQAFVKRYDQQLKELDHRLQKTQNIVKHRDNYILKIDPALQSAQEIVKQNETQILELDTALKEAQAFVMEKETQNKALNDGLNETKAIVGDQKTKIEALEIGLQEAQDIVRDREAHITRLDKALKDAQFFVREREKEIELLTRGKGLK